MNITESRKYLAHLDYTGAAHAVLRTMLLAAHPDTGLLWRKQTTIAEESGVSPRSVRYAIKRLVQDGVLEIISRNRDYTDYRVVPLDEVLQILVQEEESQRQPLPPTVATVATPEWQTVPPTVATVATTYKKEPETHIKDTESRADGAGGEEEVGAYGSLPDDPDPVEEEKKRAQQELQRHKMEERRQKREKRKQQHRDKPPGPDTHARCLVVFETEALRLGYHHNKYNQAALSRTIKELWEDGYSYTLIEGMIRRYFLHYEALARSATDVALSFRGTRGALEKWADDKKRSTGTANSAVPPGIRDNYAEKARAFLDSLKQQGSEGDA